MWNHYRNLVCDGAEYPRQACSNIQAVWSPTWGNKCPLGQLLSNWLKLPRFSSFYHEENYQGINGSHANIKTLRKNFRHGCENCLLCVQRSILGEEHFERNDFFEKSYNSFRTLSNFFPTGISKLNSSCPEVHFRFQKKRDYVHSELAKYGKKVSILRVGFPFRKILRRKPMRESSPELSKNSCN